MLLLNLLIAIFISQFFKAVDCLDGLLCKFTDIHKNTSCLLECYIFLCSIKNITLFVSTVKR